jgi:hydrogenase/urease accessory protein HupE
VRLAPLAAALVAIASVPSPARAHQAGLSYGTVAVEGSRLELGLRIPAAELATAWPELAAADRLHRGVPAELAGEVLATVAVTQGAAACGPDGAAGRLAPPDTVELSGAFRCPREGEPVRIRLGYVARLPPGHVLLAKVLVGRRVEERVVDAGHDDLEVRPRTSAWTQAGRFVRLGVEHIFTGWDHLAFLLGLVLAGRALRDVIRVVTSFTAAHALTLALATLGVVTPPAALVEPLIAASVVCVGLENLRELCKSRSRPSFRGDTRLRLAAPRTRWRLAFAFGLVHGFGFAGALRELHLPAAGLATALVSFNLGVELAQAAIVAVAFPLLVRLRRAPALASAGLPAGSAVVGAAGLVWLVQRLPW